MDGGRNVWMVSGFATLFLIFCAAMVFVFFRDMRRDPVRWSGPAAHSVAMLTWIVFVIGYTSYWYRQG